jgi:phosphate acetyltransferase
MSQGLYIATTGPNSGKSVISIGMMEMLLGKAAKVGYFRPIIDDFKAGEMDNHIRTIITHFGLTLNCESAYALTRSEVIRLKNKGKDDEIISKVIHKYKALEADFDFILVEGTDFSGEGTIIEWDINILIAKNLGIPVVLIASNTDQSTNGITSNLQIALDSFQDNGVQVLMAVANKVRPEHAESIKAALVKNLPPEVQVEVIPMNDVLANPSLREIAQELEGTVLFGENYLNNQAGAYSVGAMQLRNYLTHLKESSLVITPGDRADIILGALQANISANYPSISGIVLTGGLVPEESILKLIEGLSDIIPVISVKEGTFSITNRIGDIKPKIYAESTEKIKVSKQVFATNISAELLAERLITFKAEGITPRMFQYNLLQRARLHKKHIVLPEAYDERILAAAMLLIDAGVVNLTLIGEKSKIATRLVNLDIPLDLNRVNVLDPVNSEYFEDYAQTLYELRKHKNIDLTMARDLMTDVSYFGTMMVYKGHADGMVSGAIHTTQHTIRPALQFVKTKPGVSVVSSVFFMCLPDRVTVYGDCAINPNPTATELAEIAISSAETSRSFGIEPKVAMLSYSSGTSGAGADVDTVREATAIVKKKRPDLKVEGPIQYDAAVDMKVGKSKMPDSEVAGQASIFIFPDLNTGNNTYKAVQRETGALAIGPVLQGLNKPVNDLSRGCTVDDIFNTVIITAIQAHID